MGRACSTNGGEKRNVYRTLMGKPEGKRPLGRPRHRWVDSLATAVVSFVLWSLPSNESTCHNINKEICTVSVVFPLFCPTPVYPKTEVVTENLGPSHVPSHPECQYMHYLISGKFHIHYIPNLPAFLLE
jgi:hypothetical protein